MTLYPVRDFAKRPIPGKPQAIDLPADSVPSDYADGVYVFGNLFWKARDVAKLTQEQRRTVKKMPHDLYYGHRSMMLLADRKEVVLSEELLIAAVERALVA